MNRAYVEDRELEEAVYQAGTAYMRGEMSVEDRLSLCARKPPFRLFLRFVTLIAQTSPPSCAVICTACEEYIPVYTGLYSAAGGDRADDRHARQ